MVDQLAATKAPKFWSDNKHGPLPLFLFVLTFITGLVDAVSYLRMRHVFVGNMTGKVVSPGFALAGADGFAISSLSNSHHQI